MSSYYPWTPRGQTERLPAWSPALRGYWLLDGNGVLSNAEGNDLLDKSRHQPGSYLTRTLTVLIEFCKEPVQWKLSLLHSLFARLIDVTRRKAATWTRSLFLHGLPA